MDVAQYNLSIIGTSKLTYRDISAIKTRLAATLFCWATAPARHIPSSRVKCSDWSATAYGLEKLKGDHTGVSWQQRYRCCPPRSVISQHPRTKGPQGYGGSNWWKLSPSTPNFILCSR
eukprot:COSAG06_NODE_7155_length_2605_cov_5.372041_3_plen_118_part_00